MFLPRFGLLSKVQLALRHSRALRQHNHEFDSGSNANYFINAVEMIFDRAFAYTERVSDQSIRKASADQDNDFPLPIRQRGQADRNLPSCYGAFHAPL
jgi:hypothetical protein